MALHAAALVSASHGDMPAAIAGASAAAGCHGAGWLCLLSVSAQGYEGLQLDTKDAMLSMPPRDCAETRDSPHFIFAMKLCHDEIAHSYEGLSSCLLHWATAICYHLSHKKPK